MVRLSDLPPDEREHLLDKSDRPLGPTPWVAAAGRGAARTVALVTTAGIHARGEPAFEFMDASYRVLPGEVEAGELVMSHSSVNFDRSGFSEDVNVVFPLQRFQELAAAGALKLADAHYSFMGAGLPPSAYEQSVTDLARLLHRGGVDTVFLTPV